ncbi:hypothetical protein TCDM_12605 [Trypanosoma cruzi Dm28c]|uniref:Uncharacterized protein n=1 Tax=Trypanosoma cruzi Dm28c TaxID=1416333 RepID=V5AKW5_TRYCR|nr:hypothetical protein TCDM_12605 [Trypanosoma cruzi Dm28c]
MCVPRTQRLSSPEKTIAQPRQHTPSNAHPALQIPSCRALCNYFCVGVCWRSRKEENREAHHDGKRHSRRVSAANKKNLKNTAAGCGCVCGAAGVCPPWPHKTKQEGRNVCSAPQALGARPHVTAPSARRSSRPLLMRAAGEAHRAVVMSVSVGVRVEQLGGKHTAPLTGRVQKKQLKREE